MLGVSTILASYSPESLPQQFSEVIEARRSSASCSMHYELTTSISEKQPNLTLSKFLVETDIQDGEQFVKTTVINKNGELSESIAVKNALQLIELSSSDHVPVNVFSHEKRSELNSLFRMDPRAIGIWPSNFMSQVQPKSIQSLKSDLEHYKFKSTLTGRTSTHECVGEGFSLIFVISDNKLEVATKRFGNVVDEVILDYKKPYLCNGLPFPSQVVYTRQESGNLILKQTANIKAVSFGVKFPSSRFMLKGLGIPIGKEVTLFDEAREGIWDGEKVVSPKHELQPRTKSRAWLVLIGLITLVFGCILLFRKGK